MVLFDIFYAKTNELDKETAYLEKNISSTKDAYNINVSETTIINSGDITIEDVDENENIINNIPIVSEDVVSETLNNNQTNTGYYTYDSINVGLYDIDGVSTAMYIAPREITIDRKNIFKSNI